MQKGPLDQFVLFGDSILQQSCDQAKGFAFCPALQNGTLFCFFFPFADLSAISSPLLTLHEFTCQSRPLKLSRAKTHKEIFV